MVNREPGPPTPQLPDPDTVPADPAHTDVDDPSAEAGSGPHGLDDRSAAILAFERQWWAEPGAKEEAIRRQFDLSPTTYYQLLSQLIDDPAATRAEPMLIRRLRHQRAARSRTATDVQRPSARS